MTSWSSSQILQSLGWAILNSFWQMAVLWILYLVYLHFFKPTANVRYRLSVAGIIAGFSWFCLTFFYYLQTSPSSSIAFFDQTINEGNPLLRNILASASLAYLGLLIFPTYGLYRNWRFVQRIRTTGLSKTSIHYRLFVSKASAQLQIARRVAVFASELVTSPVTVGYVKPMILVPVAALNNLSTQQVEAILLHELSHIRRFDYIVNFMISIIQTALYFNPFVRLFMKNIEMERENCCDELVLQFGYDKLGYASALLTLEKLSVHHGTLALCARGKSFLLSRIERIVGLEKKQGMRLNQYVGMLAALICIIAFNSVMIIRDDQKPQLLTAYEQLPSAFTYFADNGASQSNAAGGKTKQKETDTKCFITVPDNSEVAPHDLPVESFEQPLADEPVNEDGFIHVAQDDIDASLSAEEKQNVTTTLNATRKILSSLQWQEVKESIADVMTETEKQRVKKEYQQVYEKSLNLKNLELQLKARYEELNWPQINTNIDIAISKMRLDSIQSVYNLALAEMEKATAELNAKGSTNIAVMPDASAKEIRRSTEELRKKVDSFRMIKTPKKVVKL